MMSHPSIRYVQRSGINIEDWDQCIRNAENGLIYGYSFYLDGMTDHWDALVWEDYAFVMPLPWRKKWGVSYLYQPYLTAQLGIFGTGLTLKIVAAFLMAIPKKFQYWDLSLNHQNLFSIPGYALQQRMNYVLDLNHSYENLLKAYRENIRRNIRKSNQYGCRVVTPLAVEEIIALTKFQPSNVTEADYEAFKKLFRQLAGQDMAKTYGVVSAGGDLLASAVFLFSHNRAYYILVGNHPNGRTLGASHALVDAFIRDHAGQNLLLDFEGSDIRNLAFFYSSFGAQEERYAAIRLNRLPWWIRWIKEH
ncbi:MAG TPA: GNAT family N-acetyltransferase [Flavisolibacter sp.]|jgi:hypothetical protein|nr:GNAT family N-acetyltransferase [Flavisolibacter sp.]